MKQQKNRNHMSILWIAIILSIITIIVLVFININNVSSSIIKITPLLVFYMLLAGIMAGWFGSIIGVGGGVIILPILHFWLGFPAAAAVGTSMIIVMYTAASGAYGHYIRQNISFSAAKWMMPAGIAGVVLGSWLFTVIQSSTELLSFLLGLAFIIPSLLMMGESLFPHRFVRKNANISIIPLPMAAFAMISGTLTGLLGLGGGYLLVPGMLYLFHLPVYITMGTSLAVIFPVATIGSIFKLSGGFVDIYAALIISAGTILGAQVGAATIKKFKPSTLKLIFSIYFFYISVKFIVSFIS